MSKPIIVQKFGGTSLADTARINAVIPFILNEKAKGNNVLVIVSAMSGITNHLMSLCYELSTLKSADELAECDVALCSGEMVSAALLALRLQQEGVKARSLLAWQIPLITDDNHSKAVTQKIGTELLKSYLDDDIIPIIAGFQGVTEANRLTTLGRGGSDTSAALIAAALQARRCDIYTDVEGVYSADPRITKTARKLTNISFQQMLALASSGAKVLHSRSVEIGIRYNIPIRVLSSFSPTDEGTLVTHEENIMEKRKITGITFNRNLSKISVKDFGGNISILCSELAASAIHVEMIDFAPKDNNYHFIIALADLAKTQHVFSMLQEERIIGEFSADSQIAIISIIGYGVKNDIYLIPMIMSILAGNQVKFYNLTVSELKISLLIEDQKVEKIVATLHEALEVGLE